MIANVKTIFFDFDGTIHDSIYVYKPAFQKAYDYLVENNLAKEKIWTNNEIAKWLGYNSKDMWKAFMPDLDENITKIASKIIGSEMENQIRNNSGTLYSGTIEVLQYLNDKGYILVFLSNCGTYFKNLVTDHYKLDKYFQNIICSQDYNFIPKYEILKNIKHNYPKEMVIIGDRIHDIEAGIKNSILTIGCSYGYGSKKEINKSNYIVNSIKELMNFL
ncbi:MAG: HAD family hydrolase [Eubacteriaceae bacterium]